MRCWPRPAGCSPGSGICRPGWWCTCCSPGACSPSWATCRSGIAWWPGWTACRWPGPAAVPGAAAGVRWRGLLVCAIDGTIMTVADSAANLAVFTKQRGGVTGGSSYPMLRLLAVVSCGTRSVIDAVFGPVTSGETSYARQLLATLRPGMILLADRNFAAGKLAAQIARAEAEFLIRVRTGRTAPALPVLARHRDGSWLSRFGGVPVRVIDAQITITTSAGRATGGYRLITTLLDPGRYPAASIVTLYHQRWDIETSKPQCCHSRGWPASLLAPSCSVFMSAA